MVSLRWLGAWFSLSLLASSAAAEALPAPIFHAREALPLPGSRLNYPLPVSNPLEAKLEQASLAKAADWLDGMALQWSQSNSCGKCHVNYVYLLARPLLSGADNAAMTHTREFIEQFLKQPATLQGAQVVTGATALAFHDAHFGGKLRPATRQALAQMWSTQKPSAYACWEKLGCGWVYPAENDYYTPMVLAALAATQAPQQYARDPAAHDGLTHLRRQLSKIPPRQLHDKVLLLWAAQHLDGLLLQAEQKNIVKELLAQQRADGGWSFRLLSLHPRSKLDPVAAAEIPSDGYGTGLAVYVLRQAGLPATQREVARGASWLRTNQRASGLWFTLADQAGEKPETGIGTRELTILNTGTAFAVMALKACE